MRKLSFLSVCVIALILDARVLSADESKELRERAVAMRKEAAELLANGHDEESNRLTKESMLLLEKARRAAKPEPGKSDKDHPDVAAMHERLGDLNAALEKARTGNAPEAEVKELEEQVQQTKKKLAHVLERIQSGGDSGHDRPELRKKLEHAHRRIEHLRVAAQNLKAAELHDLAVEVMKKAEGLEKEIRAAETELKHQEQAGHADIERELRSLREENERLRKTVEELSKEKK